MELLKDYDCTIEYHPGKANVMADAFSHKLTGNLHYIHAIQMPILVEFRKLNVEFSIDTFDGILVNVFDNEL